MGIRDSLSKLGKGLKHPLCGSKRKLDGTAAGDGGEGVGQRGLLLRPEPHVVVGNQEGTGANAGGWQVRSMNQPPQLGEPEPIPASGNRTNQEGSGVDRIDGRGVTQGYYHLRPGVGVVVGGGGDGEDVERVHPSPSNPLIPLDRQPGSM